MITAITYTGQGVRFRTIAGLDLRLSGNRAAAGSDDSQIAVKRRRQRIQVER